MGGHGECGPSGRSPCSRCSRACTDAAPSADNDPEPEHPRASLEHAEPEPRVTPKPRPRRPTPEDALPAVHHPISLPALMRKKLGPTRIVRQGLLGTADAYTRHSVTYRSGDLTISGVLLVPTGKGPFPGIVLNHGYIEPSSYVTGQGLAREQDWLARAGFAVLHTDYRGHAGSDPAPDLDREARLGYAEDAINAVRALRREPYVDPERMAMLGRSMGGGVTLNALVAKPGLVDAAVIYASVSSRFLDNLNHFTVPEPAGGSDRALRPVRYAAAEAALLPRAVVAHLLRPDHRAGADAPRHQRRVLPVPVGDDHAPAAAAGRRGRAARGLSRRDALLRAALAGLDRPDG